MDYKGKYKGFEIDDALAKAQSAYQKPASGIPGSDLNPDVFLQGPKGDKGDKGDTGATGPEGPQGIQGIQGIQGEQGPKGNDGVGISSVAQTTTSTADGGTNVVTVTLTNGTTSTFTIKNGSKGSQGNKGDKGDKGDTGEQGPKGDKGDKGDTGPEGAPNPNAITAQRLETPRQIFGHSFDGTADISGDLVGINGIAMNGGVMSGDAVFMGNAATGLGAGNNGGLMYVYGDNPMLFYVWGVEGMSIKYQKIKMNFPVEITGGLSVDGVSVTGFPIVEFASSSITLEPNKHYKAGTLSSLTVTLGAITDSTIITEYFVEFVSGSTATNLSLPASIKWYKGKAPTIEANTTYQISIIDNLGVFGAFPNS